MKYFLSGFLVFLMVSPAYAKKLKEGAAFPLNRLAGLEVVASGKGPGAQKKKVDAQTLKGKVILVDFWASWCGPCKEALPAYDSMYKKWAKKGFVVLGVNVDDEKGAGVEFLKGHPVSFAVAFDKGKELVELVGVEAMPTSFLIDKKGRVVRFHDGFRSGDEEKIRAEIERLLSSK